MIPAIRRELRDRRVSLIAYSVVGLLTLLMYMSMYPSIHESMNRFQEIYQSYPKELFKAMGIENFTISTTEGYLAVEYFSIILPILTIFFAVSRAGTAIAGEVEKGVMSFYLMLPISRSRLFLAKYTSFLISLAVFSLVAVMSIIPLAVLLGSDVGSAKVLHVTGVTFLFAWAIYAFSMWLSALFSERSKVYMIAGGVILIMYILQIAAGLKQGLAWLNNYSIFHYYYAQDILNKNTYSLKSVLVFLVSITLFSTLGWLIFRRRDIASS
ncbi:MAG TPA: ABC transporter permease subunit [Candidatus Saccharimonadales bacterium]